nr:MAG TPA: hypothetical protein [Caudoviricetes sp.]
MSVIAFILLYFFGRKMLSKVDKCRGLCYFIFVLVY